MPSFASPAPPVTNASVGNLVPCVMVAFFVMVGQ